jgi:hypothetical protein
MDMVIETFNKHFNMEASSLNNLNIQAGHAEFLQKD